MQISFGRSLRSTLGIEWEVAVVDATTLQQVPGADVVLELVDDPVDGPIRGEYLSSMLELVTGVHATVDDAVKDLSRQLEFVLQALEPHGLTILAAGCHPFSNPTEQHTRDKPQYHRVMERNGWWGQRMAVNGLHIHTGVDHRDKALPLVYGLARFAPYFIALSASSPFWEGEDTGFSSQRTMIFQQLPTNGLPYQMDTWEELQTYASQLEGVGMITNPTEIRWDVRPSQWGTVENRMMDSIPTVREIGALTAFNQVLVERMLRAIEMDEPIDRLPHWFMRENKWRAARYGLEAQVITPHPDEPTVPLRDGIRRWMRELAPIAEQLGCTDWFTQLNDVVERGASYERQRRVAEAHGGDLTAVVGSLTEELRNGAPIF